MCQLRNQQHTLLIAYHSLIQILKTAESRLYKILIITTYAELLLLSQLLEVWAPLTHGLGTIFYNGTDTDIW